jgi:hypothetical protein
MQEVMEVFRRVDLDGSGELDREELRLAFIHFLGLARSLEPALSFLL